MVLQQDAAFNPVRTAFPLAFTGGLIAKVFSRLHYWRCAANQPESFISQHV